MNLKNFIPLIAAVLLGAIALVVARKAFTRSGTGEAAGPVIGVVVATKELPAGRELLPEDLTLKRLPVDSLPSGSFRTVQELAGRTTLQPLVKGQAVIEPLLAPTGAKGGLTALIPAGHRAMTLEVNEFSGVAGMLQPGARVDVVAVLRDRKDQQSARTILQNLEVRAVGRNINPVTAVEGAPPPPVSNNVTLLVTPRQAQILNLATQNARPWLVLRNSLDKELPETELVTLAELMGGEAQTGVVTAAPVLPATMPAVAVKEVFVPPPPRPAGRVVQVIRGGVESSVKFEFDAAAQSPIMPATQPIQNSVFGPGRAITDLGNAPATE